MTTWGSQVGPLRGFMGNALVAEPVLPQFNPLRLQGNGIIQVDAPRNDPPVGGNQRLDRPIGPFAVTLSPITLENGANLSLAAGNEAQVFDYAALVKWGRGGVNMTALVDWPMNGGTFVVNGDSLYVDAWALLPISGIFSADFRDVGLRVRMGAHATPLFSGSGRGSLSPRRTMNIGAIGIGASSGDVFVPPYSRRVKYVSNTNIVSSGVNTNLQIAYRRFAATFANDLVIQTTVRSIIDTTLAFDIPPQTQSITLTNLDPDTAIAGAALVFDLDLG